MTRPRTVAALLVLCLAVPAAARSDWRTELNARLGRAPDYRAAWDFLSEEAKRLEGDDRQAAGAILPFLAAKLGEKETERSLVADYFETYKDYDPDFGFLDDYAVRDFFRFWAAWKRSYPLVYDLCLLAYDRSAATGLPGSVDIGLELLNEAFFRVSVGPYILEGGHWPAGFHILTIPLRGLFERSDSYEFVLDLKSADLIIRKPIRLKIDIADVSGPVVAPPPGPTGARDMGVPTRPIREAELSLYIDGKLVLKSRKIAARPSPFTFPLGGPLMAGQKPYMPPPKDSPAAHGVSVLDALALAYQALKDLVRKKPLPPSPPSYQKVSSLSYAYPRTAAEGETVSARASLSLSPGRGTILRE
ncbi:MAG TPA: hypothetical protein PLP83_09495 [Candidatus Aminicenantes bacterium]|nr:hypothetical protein [Candidatus Aminicenantes bacterium]